MYYSAFDSIDLKETVRIGQIANTSLMLAFADLAQNHRQLCLVLDTPSHALLVYDFIKNYRTDCHLLPDWELMPYDLFRLSSEISSTRNFTIHQLLTTDSWVIVTSIAATAYKIPPKEFYLSYAVSLMVGQSFDGHHFAEQLSHYGYQRVQEVREPGEFALRGAVLDFYPPIFDQPVRLDYFDGNLESLRLFDPQTQKSTEKLEKLNYLPATEYPSDPDKIKEYLKSFRNHFDDRKSFFYETLSKGMIPAGFSFFLPLAFKNTASFFEFLPHDCLLVIPSVGEAQFEEIIKKAQERFLLAKISFGFEPFKPEQIMIQAGVFNKKKYHCKKIITYPEKIDGLNIENEFLPSFKSDPWGSLSELFEKKSDKKWIFSFESLARSQILVPKIQQIVGALEQVHSVHEVLENSKKYFWMIASFESAILLKEHDLILLPEAHLYQQKVITRTRRLRSGNISQGGFVHTSELTDNSLIVHYQHGIGRYKGLKIMSLGSIEREMLEIEYADSDKLYVPHTDLHLISPYQSIDPSLVPLHKLGQGRWEKQREKAYEHAKDHACELLKLYATRDEEKGFSFKIPEQYVDFCEKFPFEETPDQQLAISQVLTDMQSERPMDRLICGDVGFGKTEVALRAAFVAAMNGKQTAFLTPTTLLSQQHYETLLERFVHWPIKIALMTRYAHEQQKILEGLSTGTIDIVVGTHKLLQTSVNYKDLGLVIVDEEHRFGVTHKETLKKLRTHVDVLSMTATPIPRTLSMTFQGLRDLSIIATPPARRLSISTFLYQYHQETIRDALDRELFRGGQIYYLHNDIENIEKKAQQLRDLLPNASVGVIHGKMTESAMEKIMAQFYHQRLDILVCTTIVETGIDVPSANTIIIEDAHLLGLSQLHQLRGRVGRSYHQAYAYLLIPVPFDKLPPLAQSRLEVLTRYQDLGSGFSLATHDLEIRGAGELLGDNQSGHAHDIGIDLYKQLVQKAKKTIQGDVNLENEKLIEIELYLNAYISDKMIKDAPLRLKIYQQWDRSQSIEELYMLKQEFIDRFGLMDQLTESWSRLAFLRVHCLHLGIVSIKFSPKSLQLEVSSKNLITDHLLRLMKYSKNPIKLLSAHSIELKIQISQPIERLNKIESLIDYFLGKKVTFD